MADSPLKITLLTFGSRGDVQPYVALAVGLRDAGYQPLVAAPAPFADLVTSQGVDFFPLPGDPEKVSHDLVEAAGTSLAGTIQVLAQNSIPIAEAMLAAVMEACAGADAVIHAFMMTNAGHEAARHYDIPDLGVHPYPIFSETGAYPNLMFPELPLGATYNRLTHRLFTRSFWLGSKAGYSIVRRRRPDLPPLSGWPYDMTDREVPLVIAASPAVIGDASHWGANTHVTGFLTLPPRRDWQPPADLLAFLEAGPPPVYVGFGSMIADEMAMMALTAIEALGKAGQRGLLSTGWGGLTRESLPDFVCRVDDVPHEWLFPQTAAVVHHGGAGTTAAGLRAGIPSIIIPFTADQPYWGRRVARLGVGPEPIPRKKLTADGLAYAIRTACTHQPMRQRAAALGEVLRAEDGVGDTVNFIKSFIERARGQRR